MRGCLLLVCICSFPCLAAPGVTWNGEAEIAWGYDTNVTVDDVDLASSRGDQFRDLDLSGGLVYETESESRYSFDVTVSDKSFNAVDKFDGLLVFASLGYERKIREATLDLTARLVDYQLDSEDFLNLTQYSAGLSWFSSKRTYTRIGYDYADEKFTSDRERSNHEQKLSFLGYFFVSGLKRYLTLRVQYGEASATSRIHDHRTREVRLTYDHEFENGLKLGLGYRWQDRRYLAEAHPQIQGFRDDIRRRAELNLEWPLGEHASIGLELFGNDSVSNLPAADYQQEIYQLNLKYKL